MLNFFLKNTNLNDLSKTKKISNLNFKFKYQLLKFLKTQNFNNLNNFFFIFYEIFFTNFFSNIVIFIFSFKKLNLISSLNLNNNNSVFFFSNFSLLSSNNFNLTSNLLDLFFFKINKIDFINKYSFSNFKNSMKLSYLIKFSISDFFKYLNNKSLQSINVLFLRKNKVFNKGRYSRNRQYYRTGVYWCLYVNIVAVVGLYFWFYRFNMNFGYLWWILYFFFFSLFFSRSYSLNVFGIKQTFIQIFSSFYWFLNLINNLFTSILNFLLNLLKIYKK